MRSARIKGATETNFVCWPLSPFSRFLFCGIRMSEWEAKDMKKQHVAIMIAGLTLFGFVAGKIGWSDVARELRAMATALPILFVLSAVRIALQTAAWPGALRVRGILAGVKKLIGLGWLRAQWFIFQLSARLSAS
jgi:hypothetical protein